MNTPTNSHQPLSPSHMQTQPQVWPILQKGFWEEASVQIAICLPGDESPLPGFGLELHMCFSCPTLIQPPQTYQPKQLGHPHEDSHVLQLASKKGAI